MSVQAPEGGGRPGGGAGRRFGGLPLWAWGVAAAAAIGGIVYLRLRSAGSSPATATTSAVSTSAQPADQQIGLTQYEQISAELVGIEGTDQALLAAIKDLQGDVAEPAKKKAPDKDARQDKRQAARRREAARDEAEQDEAEQDRRQARRKRRRDPDAAQDRRQRRVRVAGRPPAGTPARRAA